MTQSQIEEKQQLLKQKMEEVKVLTDELKAVGALPLDTDDLDTVTGGLRTMSVLQQPQPIIL